MLLGEKCIDYVLHITSHTISQKFSWFIAVHIVYNFNNQQSMHKTNNLPPLRPFIHLNVLQCNVDLAQKVVERN